MIAAIAVVAILIGSSAYVMFLAPVKASMDPDDVTIEAGQTMHLSVAVKKGIKTVTSDADAKYRWRLDPDTLATFNLKSKPSVNLTAGIKAGTGTLSCEITYKGETVTLSKTVTVKKPFLDQIVITPSTKTLDKGMSAVFSASAVDSVANPIAGLTYTWAVTGLVSATLNSTSGASVNLTTGDVYGNVTLSATASFEGVSKTGSAVVTIGQLPPRSVDYVWYDMFNVPFGEWWDMRWTTYHIEEPISDSYPYLFKWHGQPGGNVYVYTNMRLNITGRNMTDLSMNENPEFLPLHGTAKGGTAVIDWYMQYLTTEEMKRYPAATSGWNDGWVVALNGTVRLDKQAAMSVLKGMTSSAFDSFSTWWSTHQSDVQSDLTSWLVAEAGPNASRPDMDIYPMYDALYSMLTGQITATKEGSEIVLTYDLVTWGIEALITRWMHEAFMPTEWYFEDMDFHAVIGPERSDIDIDTAVAYAVYAYEVTNTPPTGPEPCWVWEALLQDYVSSSPPEHPYSGYDLYSTFEYLNTAPGSDWYNKNMTYDYEPGAFNLSTNETMRILWPQGQQDFEVHIPWTDSVSGKNETGTRRDTMWIPYSEPMEPDNHLLAPGSVTIDNDANFIEFEGPIDMWSWSKNQNETNHQWLRSEWERMGMLPYGAPYIEFWPEHGYTPTISKFVMTGVAEMPLIDTATNVTVTAYDEIGRKFSGFVGGVTFSSDRTDLTLPGDYTFLASEGGVHKFENLSFQGTGDYTITVSSIDVPLAQGNYSDIWAIPDPEILTGFDVTVIGVKGIVMQGLSSDVRVKALNQYAAPHSQFKGYGGTVVFTTNATTGTYLVPPSATFQAADRGVIVVRGLQFNLSGAYNLTVSDLDAVPIVASTVNVSVQSARIDYRIYDMFEQPWGDWWEWRLAGYRTDIILNDKPHEYTFVYNPDKGNQQGIIYAPYRWNMTAIGVPSVNVHDPEFMPVLGTPGQTGAEVDMHIWFQYLDNATWNGYWRPTWSSNWNWSAAFDDFMPADGIRGQFSDGYYLGVVYTVSMNREAALEWIGIPVSDDAAVWWDANNASYMEQWQHWIFDEGNYRLDIWPAYEWTYVDMGTMMTLTPEPSGKLTLRIAHFGWGFEALMTRWLNETALCKHEPYMEDFNLSAHLTEGYADVSLDAVAQYNLHAVKANQTDSDPAWVWEPQRMDYVFYDNPVSGYVSEFNPWVPPMAYTSWNSGDGFFNDSLGVFYDFTPQWFNLTSYMTLEIQLPTGDNVIGYNGEGLTTAKYSGAIYELKKGNTSAYDNITVHGPMWLGYSMTGTGAGAPDLSTMYNNATKTLYMVGPLDFDNFRFPNGLLYHSAPWIEFNVANLTFGPLPDAATVVADTVEAVAAGHASSVDVVLVQLAGIALLMVGSMAVVATLSEDVRRKE